MENMSPQGPPTTSGNANKGCWKWGAIGCIGLGCGSVLLIVGVIAAFMMSPMGKQIVRSSQQVATMQIDMKVIKKGIDQYKVEKKGYPKSLKDLYPAYINEERILHMNKDASRPLYTYHLPEKDAAEGFVLLEGEAPAFTADTKPVKVKMLMDGTFEGMTITTNDGRNISPPATKARPQTSGN